jgi:4-amino-4-deoxy-L-arabinose transferase-like glycosyltransferase
MRTFKRKRLTAVSTNAGPGVTIRRMSRITRNQALAAMLLCLLVAAALRLPGLPAAPPGLHYDEATNGLLSADIGLRGARPVFTPGFTGQEPLFFYLAGGLMRLLGPSLFALRLTAAFIGLLTVAATYWLGRELLADRRLALLAAVLLAVTFWHLLFSRLGLRAISQPLLQALTVATLWRGLRRGQARWLVAAGICLGLTGYTYLAARLFPAPLLLAALPLLFNRATARTRWRQLALFAGVGLLALLPLLLYFAAHPDAFWVRIHQVAPATTQPTLTLWQSYGKALAMFFLAGDPYVRFNLPGRPLFDWFWGALLPVGWLACIWRWRTTTADWQRGALVLLLAVPPLMILPTALATNEIVPSNLRAIGLVPFLFYLPPIGLLALLEGITAYLPRLRATPILLAAALIFLLVGGWRAHRLYFNEWATRADLFYESDGDLAAVARFLDETDLNNKTAYVAALHYQHPTLAFLSRQYEAVKWLPGSQALPFPAAGPAIYIYPYNSPLPDWAAPYLPTGRAAEGERPTFTVYEQSASPPVEAPNQASANFGNVISLIGYETAVAPTGATLPVTLYWRVENQATADYMPFIHLEDGWRERWGQAEPFAYPATQWAPGERFIQRIDVPVRPGAPPGFYRLRVGLFNPATGERLPHLDADGRYAGDAFLIENAPIIAGPPPEVVPRPPIALNATVRPGLQLLGYERGGATIATGETAALSLWWWATQPVPALTTRLELMRADNTGRILLDTQPVHGTYPFAQWTTPLFLIDQVTPRIPDDFPPGDYRLNLRLLDGNGGTLLTADLGPLTVVATERLFTPPAVHYPLAAVLGNEINLLGYNLAVGETAGSYTLTLVWQAQATPTADYTVFVHLLQPDGRCCAWQQDTMPQQNGYATSRWLPGEVVVDSYTITLPPDAPTADYPLEVGLYMAENGRRLQVTQPGGPVDDAVYLRPLSTP